VKPKLDQHALKAWVSARAVVPYGAEADVLDQLIKWKMCDPRFVNKDKPKGQIMQRQWTIEIRADFADPAKNDTITKLVKEASVFLHANTALISDVQKPQVACYSDDFFFGHKDIPLHGDTLGSALAAHGDKVGEVADVSDELLNAAAELAQPNGNK
jgi:hypothetical protein